MNVVEFIEYIVSFDNIDDILNECRDQSDMGFTYERIWDICIKFGFCEHFPSSDFTHMVGNVNDGNIKPMNTFTNYLKENYRSGNSNGCADICLFNNVDETYTFITSKYPKTSDDEKRQKSVDYYDISKIVAVNHHNDHIYANFNIFILVPNKTSVLKKIERANKSSKYITKYMTDDNILDKDDLNRCFLQFKSDILKHGCIDAINFDELYLNPKEKLCLRFHQELITRNTSSLIEEGNKKFLWGCKCRSGKTYMIGGLIIKQYNVKQKLNVLIITPAPTETAPQFTDDLFNKFREFEIFTLHHIKGSKCIKNIKIGENNIFVVSKQMLQKYTGAKTISMIKNLNIDIIGFDENHFGGTTDLSKSILRSYASKNTIKVYLTATYNKPLREWDIPSECQMYWDIEDEQICKKIISTGDLSILQEKHGRIDSTLKHFTEMGLSVHDIFKPYENMPELYLITNMFDSQRYEIIKEKIMGSKYGFCFDSLFALNKTGTKFKFEKEVVTVMRYISGSQKEVDFKNGDKSIFTRVSKICSEKETRTPFTQIWFLPSNNIGNISKCLKRVMSIDNILARYDVMCINRSSDNDLAKDIKDEIINQEKKAKADGKSGLILLAGDMLTLGITLNLCDIVLLMNNTLSSDKILQQMYRCMTEGTNKKYGFVVDLNISRVINTCVNYTIYKNNKSIEDKMKYLIENHLINIDADMMVQKKIDIDGIVKKIMDVWKSDPINSFKALLKNLENDFIEFDNPTQKLLNASFTSSAGEQINTTIEISEEPQELPNGKERITDDIESKDEKEVKPVEINISFTKDVLPFIIPLTCILTVRNNNKDFVKMMRDIQKNPTLLDIFDDMCLLWWNKKDLIELIKNIVSTYFDKNSNAYNIAVNFKLSMQSLIDSPKKLLELINDCLKPKDVEKKKFGEVFTPMVLINEMLDKLPIYVWKDKNLKWLDPCCGMGNFPSAIYLRLMESLKDDIIDTADRKKHILEDMLYMSELNKKNVFICLQIFNFNNELKLNIYEGDSLKVDYNKEFGVKKFDIIVGNPPYNAAGTKATGNTIWQLFVNSGIDLLKENGHICFIHPNGWRKPNTEKGKFYGLFEKMVKENTMLYLEIHDTKDGMRQFNCGTRYDWYILQKKKNIDHKTKILDQDSVLQGIDLIKYNWLANCELELIDKLIAVDDEEKCNILYSRSSYGADKKWISKVETNEFKYPVVHSTPKEGHRFVWSSKNTNGHYGVKKIIFGDSGINNPIIDIDGIYGMTQHAMALLIDDIEEGEKISKVLCSPAFEKILKACLWSSFAIEWGMFKDLKKNFYEILNIEKQEKDEEAKPKKLELKIIKHKRKNYYLIDDKIYSIKKNKTQGELFGNYIDEQVVQI